MIYIQTLNNRQWNAGVKLFKSLGLDKQLLSEFQRYISEEFVKLYISSIDKQRFRMKWRPLTPGYLIYKKIHGLSLNIWEATGQLKKSLYVRNVGSRYCIGFDKRVNHKYRRIRLYRLAHILEYGTMTRPPRPLFRYIYMYMNKHISMYFNRFIKEHNISITSNKKGK